MKKHSKKSPLQQLEKLPPIVRFSRLPQNLKAITLIVLVLIVAMIFSFFKDYVASSNSQVEKEVSQSESTQDEPETALSPSVTASQNSTTLIKNPTSTHAPSIPTSTPTNAPTNSPAPTNTPSLPAGLSVDQVIPLCIGGYTDSCDNGWFSGSSDSGVNYVIFHRTNGTCAKFNLSDNMVAIYTFSAFTKDTVDSGPKETKWTCDSNFYTKEGYNYLKSQGKTPNGL